MNTFQHRIQTFAASYIKELKLSPGEQVADLGSGSGLYSKLAGSLVGKQGHVYALEAIRGLVEKLAATAKSEGFFNITSVWADIEKKKGTRLRSGSIDVCIVANVLFQIEDKKAFLLEIKRILSKSKNARVLCVCWRDSFNGQGPSEDLIVKESDSRDLFEANGFSVSEDFSQKHNDMHHYAFIAYKKY